MKKQILISIVILSVLALTGCTKQEVNKGLYIIPIVFLGLAVYKFYNTWKGYSQGETKQQLPSGTVYTKRKTIPVGELIYGIAFLIASVGTSIGIYSENRNYDPRKDGIPKEAPMDGRESAEDQLKKAK